MLINFQVKNFRSIRDEIQLYLLADGRYKNHQEHLQPIIALEKPALKLAVLYGANAAGKSNTVRAIGFVRDMVLEPGAIRRLQNNQFARKSELSSEFRVQFQSDQYQFDFGFELHGNEVIKETLVIEGSDQSRRDAVVYRRCRDQVELGKLTAYEDGKKTMELLDTLDKLGIKDDELLLHKVLQLTAKSKRGRILDYAISWFAESLNIVQPNTQITSTLSVLDENKKYRTWTADFLAAVDTGIGGLAIKQDEISADKLPQPIVDSLHSGNMAFPLGPGLELSLADGDGSKVVRRSLKSVHGKGKQKFELPFAEESDGTQRFFELLPALYLQDGDDPAAPIVYFIDELDRSLHPLLSRAFVAFFSKVAANRPIQLIFTTHATHLLDSDLLRPDEIWFVEKGANQVTNLSSLSEFSVRNDLRLERGYLHGTFGAIPVVAGFENLLDESSN